MSLHDLSKLTAKEQIQYLESCSKEDLVKYSLMGIMLLDAYVEERKK